MTHRQLLLVSSSACHPHGYLDHCAEQTKELFAGRGEVLFVPYARPSGKSHEAYTDVARSRFEKLGFRLRGVHEFDDPVEAVRRAEGVFVGGGNTFVLLAELYELGLVESLRRRVLAGTPYMGTSAGSNIAGLSIGTSNDMPIMHPPSFDALGLVPLNINPHYPKRPPDPEHRGETRETRIQEFHVFNRQPVVALREDAMLRVADDRMQLAGDSPCFLFQAGRPRETLEPGADLSRLLGVS